MPGALKPIFVQPLARRARQPVPQVRFLSLPFSRLDQGCRHAATTELGISGQPICSTHSELKLSVTDEVGQLWPNFYQIVRQMLGLEQHRLLQRSRPWCVHPPVIHTCL